MIDKSFWLNRKVFITGHTGFKGSWLCLWLHSLGAKVTGYALEPPTNPSLFRLSKLAELITSTKGDIRDRENLKKCMVVAEPEIVFHLAAQPLVRDSYRVPVETYETNVMGTVNILEAVRCTQNTVRAFVNVTTDKVYENREWCWGYRENEPLGGYDPYSNSKACSELVTSAYRNSYFNPTDYSRHGCAIATARAGNVIGGGDWATDRVVPDSIRSLLSGMSIKIRNPKAIRPWQHVLEPLCGYLMLAEKLFTEGPLFSDAWNFGPNREDSISVEKLVGLICCHWGGGASYEVICSSLLHEASYLILDCSKVEKKLGWSPIWHIEKATSAVVDWTKKHVAGSCAKSLCIDQIEEYEAKLEATMSSKV